MSALGLTHHCLRQVDSDSRSSVADELAHGRHLLAGAAADVESPLARAEAEEVDRVGLGLLPDGGGPDGVEVGDPVTGRSLTVHPGEA